MALMGLSRNPFSAVRKGNEYLMLINGEWIRSLDAKTFDIMDPSTGGLVAKAQAATQKQAVQAIDSACMAAPKMASLTLEQRSKILMKTAELLQANSQQFVETLITEAGKPRPDAEREVAAGVEQLKAVAGDALSLTPFTLVGVQGAGRHTGKKGIIHRIPVGVVLAITPFNYPLISPISKIAPAIAAGNAVVLKPASDTPLVGLMLARMFQLAGVPNGGLNAVTGSGAVIGDILAAHPKAGMISFTGNTETGKHIAHVAGMKLLHLELGGKCPALVLQDADLDIAAKECVTGAFAFSGQRCDALSRVLVVEKVADAFVKKAVAEAMKFKLANPNERDVMGPLINERAVQKVSALVGDAQRKGAKLLMGGKVSRLGGLFFEPTVLDRVPLGSRIAWEETFGPILTIIRVKNEKEAVALANASCYGLDASVFTKDMKKAREIAMKLEDGVVHVNARPSHGIGDFPFGGDKDSGIGREGLYISVREMTKLHTIVEPE